MSETKEVNPTVVEIVGTVRKLIVIPRTSKTSGDKINMVKFVLSTSSGIKEVVGNPGYLRSTLSAYGVNVPESAVEQATEYPRMHGRVVSLNCEKTVKGVTTYLTKDGKIVKHSDNGLAAKELFVIDGSSFEGRALEINRLEKSGMSKFAISTAASSMSATSRAMIANYVDDETDDLPEGVTLGAAVEQ